MFTGVVVIIVFFILEPIQPFAAWIIRTSGMVYGFFTTTIVIVGPKAFGLAILDPWKARQAKKSPTRKRDRSASAAYSSASAAKGILSY
jgi:hypothetical protein